MAHVAILAAIHGLAFVLGYAIAYGLRFDFSVPPRHVQTFWSSVAWVAGAKLLVFYLWGNFHGWLRHVSFADLLALGRAALLSLLTVSALDALFPGLEPIPKSVLLLDCLMTVVLLGALRCFGRFSREQVLPLATRVLAGSGAPRRAVLVISDVAGETLARQIHAQPQLGYQVIGYLHTDAVHRGTRLGGIPVLGTPDGLAGIADRFDDVLVMSDALSGKCLRSLMDEAGERGITVRMVPALDQILSHGSGPWLRDVDINDLLHRDPVVLECGALSELLEGQVALVTGAGGSIGSEICRQLVRFRPGKLVLLGRGENRIFAVERELREMTGEVELVPVIADITDRERMRRVFARHRPDIVFHAAAHKHVPLMEQNVGEAVKNNVLGTQCVADLAEEFAAARFVLISTDKAVNPTSVMGACKQLAERYVYALSQRSATRFMAVRFGNVLGSAGSAVPIFQEQIRRGGPITVTDPRMVRYFMSIPEAAQLVLQAAAIGKGGEVFVLDMGEPVPIVNLVHDLIRLSGMPPGAVDIVYTGLRPGEKLYEELYSEGEHTLTTRHPKVRAAYHRPVHLDEARQALAHLRQVVHRSDEQIRRKLRALVPEFTGDGHGRGSSPEPERAAGSSRPAPMPAG